MTSRFAPALRCGTIVWALLTMACSAPQDPTDDRAAALATLETLDGTEWELSTLEGRPLVAGSRVTLRFTGETAGGYGGCNWYGGRYTAAGASLQIGSVMSTERACAASAMMAQEQRYYSVLGRVAAYGVAEGNRLELLDRSNRVLAALTARARQPMDPAALVGTRWRLHQVDGAPATASPAPTLGFTATGISGYAGCRDYTGTYEARGDELRVTSIRMVSTDCPAGDAALLREGDFTTYLSETSNYHLSGDSLELLTFSGHRVLFLAQSR